MTMEKKIKIGLICLLVIGLLLIGWLLSNLAVRESTPIHIVDYCEKNSDCPSGKECFNLICTDPENIPTSGWEECTPAGPFAITCGYVNGKCYCCHWEEWECKRDEDCDEKYIEEAKGKYKCAEQKVCMPTETYNRYFTKVLHFSR